MSSPSLYPARAVHFTATIPPTSPSRPASASHNADNVPRKAMPHPNPLTFAKEHPKLTAGGICLLLGAAISSHFTNKTAVMPPALKLLSGSAIGTGWLAAVTSPFWIEAPVMGQEQLVARNQAIRELLAEELTKPVRDSFAEGQAQFHQALQHFSP